MARTTWPSVEEFCAARPGRRAARQSGRNGWVEPGSNEPWRISFVWGLGEVIAVRGENGPVELLGTAVAPDVADAVLTHLPSRRSLVHARAALAGLATVDPGALNGFMAAVVAHRLAEVPRDLAVRRAGFVCRDPAGLPPVEIPVEAEMRSADWPTIGTAAAAAVQAGVDPVDRAALGSFLGDRLDEPSLAWALGLFTDPITLATDESYVNGRHRSACLRITRSPITVVCSEAAEEAARDRLGELAKPIVGWL